MSRIVPLDTITHADLCVAVRAGADVGDASNQMLLLPVEFDRAQRDFPILIRRDESGRFFAVALLGLDPDENLWLDGERWTSRYIPLVQAVRPFTYAVGPDGTRALAVDLDDPRVGSDGEPLFLRHGGIAPYLQHAAKLLKSAAAGEAEAAGVYAAWMQEGLIRPVSLDVQIDEGRSYLIEDVFTVSTETLTALDGHALARLNSVGALAPAFAVASSLGNIEHLIAAKRRQQAPL